MGMKRILTFLFLLSSVLSLSAANPSFTDMFNAIPWTNDTLNLKQRSTSTLGVTGTVFNISIGRSNIGIGPSALKANTKSNNIAVGYRAMHTTANAYNNVSIGNESMTNGSVTAIENVGIGHNTLERIDGGAHNSVVGFQAAQNLRDGENNSVLGTRALNANQFRSLNVAIGYEAMVIFTTGGQNVCVGGDAMDIITTANDVTAVGYGTLDQNASATRDTAIGSKSMGFITTATARNTGVGYESLRDVEDAQNNVGVGYQVALGIPQLTNCTFIGYAATAIAGLSNATAVGSGAFVGENDTMTLGNAAIVKAVTPGYYVGTNGFASYSTLATNAVGGSGYTNNQVINQVVYLNGTAVAVTQKNRSGTTIVPATTFTGTMTVLLQPGWAVTAASGLTGTAVPF
jgi:hypothetical protein